jgi:hypothetical protein
MQRPNETDLYPPVKRFLEGQGYTVKAEIGACDVMAVRGADVPVIVELKTGFTLALLYQAIDRQKVTDLVYVCVPEPKKGIGRDDVVLCRRLGLGLLVVKNGWVEAHLDPAPYVPRKHNPGCAHYLDSNGAARIRDVVAATRVARAAGIFRSDVYGWFEKVERGTYAASPKAREALATYADVVAAITA